MNPVQRFFGRNAVFSALGGMVLAIAGTTSLITGFLRSTTISIIFLVAGVVLLAGARSMWKVRKRIPDELPPPLAPEVRARNYRRTNRMALVGWLGSLGLGYALVGLSGMIVTGLLAGVGLFVSIRKGRRAGERWTEPT
jgi:hypothetical protein